MRQKKTVGEISESEKTNFTWWAPKRKVDSKRVLKKE